MSQQIINLVNEKFRKKIVPEFNIGNTISVHVKITEGAKERIQQFVGLVIARKGRGMTETFTVRRIVANQGVERTFMLHAPNIAKVEVQRVGKARRAKLYYLRDRVGKARKLRERRISKTTAQTAPPKPPTEPEPELATV
jgi:large subunit ribosomal protein L19